MTDEASSQGATAARPSPAWSSPELSSAELLSPERSEAETTGSEGAAGPNLGNRRWRRRVTLISLLVVVLAAALVLPPLINIGRYQRKITALMSRSLGRPVHLSGVELRLLPSPGFVLHDLSVSEDPNFGVEPVLSARTVVASIRILSLWRGKVVVSRISVDEASLNLVRSPQGRWNLQSLMTGGFTGGLPGAAGSAAPNAGGSLSGFSRRPAPFPYLEATNSRVNFKNGAEKSPFSLVETELSLWQDQPGAWRLRLRGQPVRTDMEMSSADTGQLQVEASLQSSVPARELRETPLKLQAEWRDAQLGQLSRLVLGSDAGWRGDLTADLDVQGTPDAAQTKVRLRATGVRREEFAPETPLDFDANCSFRYQHSLNAVHGLGCDSAIGAGQLHLKADIPGDSGKPEAMLQVNQIPLQAGLDLLRTVRSGFAPGIVAQGAASGSLSLMTSPPVTKNASRNAGRHEAVSGRSEQGRQDVARKSKAGNGETGILNLQGSISVEHGLLKGGALKEPIPLPKIIWAPTLVNVPANSTDSADLARGGFETGLGTRFTVPLGAAPAPAQAAASVTTPASGSAPLAAATKSPAATPPKSDASQAVARPQEITVRLGLTADGYDVNLTGSTGTAKLRDLAYAFGAPHLDAVDSFSGGIADINLTAAGPWIPSSEVVSTPVEPVSGQSHSGPSQSTPARASAISTATLAVPGSDVLAGLLQLHHAEWKSAFLARPVEFAQGTVNLVAGSTSGLPAVVSMASDFSYGSLKGLMAVNAPVNCKTGDCRPQVQLRLGAVDASDLEVALLGVPEKKSLLSPLMDRIRPSERPKWPAVTVNVQADSLVLGPAILSKPTVRVRMAESEIVLESWAAGLLDGSAKGTGSCSWTDAGLKYALEGDFTKLSAASLGAILNGRPGKAGEDGTVSAWSGGPVSGSGSIQLTGLTGLQLAASADGTVRFDWPHGSIPSAVTDAKLPATTNELTDTAQSEIHFDDWSGTATIQGGKVQLGENVMREGKRSLAVAGTIPFGGPAKLAIASASAKTAGASGHAATHAATYPAVRHPAVQ